MITGSLITKWKKMLKNESVFHVKQTESKFYSVDEVKGYYNDLRGKVLYTANMDEAGIPFHIAASGKERKKVYFVIAIFQYGLGAYDLYLEKKETAYRGKMLKMADWAVEQQADDGSWDAFGTLGYSCVYSSMAQGEGASLLARAYVETGEETYRKACIKAVNFMLKPADEGGTCTYTSDGIVLLEYPAKATVLNGWIFSAFGLLDCWKITKDELYLKAWNAALNGIKKNIARFDAGHWSYYDWSGKYASPFYHELHIALLRAVNELDHDAVFEQYIEKWTKCKENKLWAAVAFWVKAKQKVFEKKSEEWVLVS